MKDPGFKLFGKTIPMRDGEENEGLLGSKPGHENTCYTMEAPAQFAQVSDKDVGKEMSPEPEVEGPHDNNPEETRSITVISDCGEDECKKSMEDLEREGGSTATESDLRSENLEEKEAKESENLEEKESKASENQDKILKKPDKLLPCPRCDSLDTKFCYYNNYNVNQPRHFCKNCQRYWTAGGTMRNVPVGAGRRKNKHSTSHYRHMMMTDGLTTARADAPDAAAHHQVIPNAHSSSSRVLKGSHILLPLDVESASGTILNFGPDFPLCESMSTALNLADQTVVTRKAFINKEDEKGPLGCGENRDDTSCESSITASTTAEKEEASKSFRTIPQVDQGGMMGWPSNVPPPQHYYGGGPWAYGWNFCWGGRSVTGGPSGIAYAAESGNTSAGSWNNGTSGAGPPGMWAAGIPWPFVPGPYWGSPTGWGGGTWNMPFSTQAPPVTGRPSSGPSSSSAGSSGSATLGKHSRDITQSEGKPDGCLWVPKTIRIDDPDEAARSSIWTTLGIGNKPESITTGGIFKAFQPKTEVKDSVKVSTQGLRSNPAALSRSMAFQESS